MTRLKIWQRLSNMGTKISRKNTVNKDLLENAYNRYLTTGNIRTFMEGTSDYTLTFIKRNLNDDEDIACEFYLHFYEKSERFMEKFEMRDGSPIAAFLSRYLKNEYMNFIRKKRNRSITELTGMDSLLLSVPSCTQHAVEERVRIESLHEQLSLLPLKLRLPLKMYFGMDLNLKELHNLTVQNGDPEGTAVLLKKYNEKKEKIHLRQLALINRAARLNYMINSESVNLIRVQRWISLKKQIELRLQRISPVTSLHELSLIFGLNKSSMSRRIKKAMVEIENNEKDVMGNYEDIS